MSELLWWGERLQYVGNELNKKRRTAAPTEQPVTLDEETI